MNTPISDFLADYEKKGTVRLHMPGHKGKKLLGFEGFDLTEIDGADVLYNSSGIIFESQKNAEKLFDTKKTLYSTEGSSLSIRAMLYLAVIWAKKCGKEPYILAARNSHKSFMNAIAALDAKVEWIYPSEKDGLLATSVNSDALEERFSSGKKPTALYLTSPDYLGNCQDIEAISKVCKRHGILLLVDNAHGAYLAFLNPSRHPIALGADICTDSAHKTLPVLTGGGYLHISKDAPDELAQLAPIAMQTFASTSPSYLILASLDKANAILEKDFPDALKATEPKLDALAKELSDAGYDIIHTEPLKITVCPKSYGYTGDELYLLLKKEGLVAEYSDSDYLVMMFSPFFNEKELGLVEKSLIQIPKKTPIITHAPMPKAAIKRFEIKEAIMSPSEEISVKDSLGRTLAASAVSCPPAIPIVIAGETIDENAIECFEYYGISKCRVVME